jgi:hypothetical protein
LLLYHVPAPAALGGVLLYHALALWIPALSGTVGFIAAQRQINYGGVRADPGRATGSAIRVSQQLTRGEDVTQRRGRRSSSAIQNACRARFSECACSLSGSRPDRRGTPSGDHTLTPPICSAQLQSVLARAGETKGKATALPPAGAARTGHDARDSFAATIRPPRGASGPSRPRSGP